MKSVLFIVFVGILLSTQSLYAQLSTIDSVTWYLQEAEKLRYGNLQKQLPYIKNAEKLVRPHHDTMLYLEVLKRYVTISQDLMINQKKTKSLVKKIWSIASKDTETYWDAAIFYYEYQRIYNFEHHHFDVSMSYLNKIINLYKQQGNAKLVMLNELNKLGYYDYLGQLDKMDSLAEYFYREVVPALQEKEPIALAEFEAKYYTKKGDIAKAIQYYKEAIRVRESTNIKLTAYRGYQRLGQVHKMIGEYKQALYYYTKSLHMMEALYGEGYPGVSKIYNQIGEAYRHLGEYEEALTYYNEAYRISMKYFGKISFRVGSVSNNIGETYHALGNYVEALKWHKQALDIRKSIPYNPYLTNSYDHIGAAYTRLRAYDEAKIFLTKALKMREAMPKTHIYSVYRMKSYKHMAEYYQALGELEKANLYFQKGIDENTKNYRFDGNAKYQFANQLGEGYLLLNQFDLAIETFDKAISYNVPSYVPNEVTDVNLDECYDRISLLESLYGKARAIQKKGLSSGNQELMKTSLRVFHQADLAVDLLRKDFTSQKDKIRLGNILHDFYESASQICWQLYRSTKDKACLNELFFFSERSKAGVLADVQLTRQAKQFAHLPDSILNKERELNSLISYYKQKVLDGDQLARHQAKLIQTKHDYAELLTYLEENYPEYHKLKYTHAEISVAAIQEGLADDETLLEYFFLHGRILAFIIEKDHFQVKSLHEVAPRQVAQMRKGLMQGVWQYYATNAHQLYKVLIEPLEPELTKPKLTIVPDGLLWYVNFDLLLTKPAQSQVYQEQAYLIHDFTIRYLYAGHIGSNKLEGTTVSVAKTNKLLAFAPSYKALNSDTTVLNQLGVFRDLVGELEWNTKEVEQIVEAWEGEGFFGEEASEKEFKTQFGGGKILHLAMHALLDDDKPEQSRLVFTYTKDSVEDDFLNVYELYNMEFDAELAVLSACNTGVGKLEGGEGMMSLGRAFAYAGCPAVVMSQWRVDDLATATIMASFYELMNKGESKSVALRQAKLAYLQAAGPKAANPFLWGSFVMVGDDKPLNKPTNTLLWIGLALGLGLTYLIYSRFRK